MRVKLIVNFFQFKLEKKMALAVEITCLLYAKT